MTQVSDYLKKIGKALESGNATEHTHRPALQALIESLSSGITATNEPKRVACGAPDFIVTHGHIPLGYIEAKNVDKPLDEIENGEQMGRYLESLSNLVLTDYLEFRWYLSGKHRLTARLASVGTKGKLRIHANGAVEVTGLLTAFLDAQVPTVGTPKDLAARMAALARLIRDIIRRAFVSEDENQPLHQQMEGFRKVLLHHLTEDQFADMYAQTICYGLFAARCNVNGDERFTRQHAAYDLPKTNPFLRKLFGHIAGPDLDERIVWAVEDLVQLLNRADIAAILKDFGKRTRREDPVVHFYETFLAAYDPDMREARGIYYTPEPVVSYIVRSVDHILKKDFRLTDGLANSDKIKVKNPGGKGKLDVHKVLILDPAVGTGTFLFSVVDLINESFKGNKGMWSSYVSQHLLPRIFGFELLIAPYAVAHMKLGLQLVETGYDFSADERLRVYLTNTLEEAHEMTGLPLFTHWLAEEANAASKVKQEAPVMVVLGNPPYSGHSANFGQWMISLLKGMDTQTGQKTSSYFEVDGQPLQEIQVKWLHDDYVKFMRFAQWRIERTGYGILAFITNHGYLQNPTFRGMRQSLLQTFDDIYVLDLHGSKKKKEMSPDGSKDENVFDIQQGVAIGIFVKGAQARKKAATVHHADLWGPREIFEEGRDEKELVGGKYQWLYTNSLATTSWTKLVPESPSYFFVPQDRAIGSEFRNGWALQTIFPDCTVGIVTARDSLTIQFSREEVLQTVHDFVSLPIEEAREKYELGKDARDWKVELAQKDLRSESISNEQIVPILYRPFDSRFTYYTGQSRGFIGQPQQRIMRHMIRGNNLGLSTCRSIEIGRGWEHMFCTSQMIQHHSVSLKEVNYLFPLYLYPDGSLFDSDQSTSNPNTRFANLTSEFIEAVSMSLKLALVPDGKGDLKDTFGPEDVLHYVYAVSYSPTYRNRYADFLKKEFPRIPLTSNPALFCALCGLGATLVSLHLMEDFGPKITSYPIAGDNMVETVDYTEPVHTGSKGRVWINKRQYFDGVPPAAWDLHIGGYQVCQRWLKDRKGRQLTYDDLTKYQNIVAALTETIRLMATIDEAIEENGGWPVA